MAMVFLQIPLSLKVAGIFALTAVLVRHHPVLRSSSGVNDCFVVYYTHVR